MNCTRTNRRAIVRVFTALSLSRVAAHPEPVTSHRTAPLASSRARAMRSSEVIGNLVNAFDVASNASTIAAVALLGIFTLGLFFILFVRARARATLARASVPAVTWRPKFLWRLYSRSARSLLQRVEQRFRRGDGSGRGRRAFGAVVGACPFVHVGEARLARDVLRETSRKAPLYHAFEAFSGTGIFTAEGDDWDGKRTEVLRAFHDVGLASLRDRAVEESASAVEEMREVVERGGGEIEARALPILQRLALRVTFAYLTGVSLRRACEDVGRERSEVEGEYLDAATTLRHLIPARARSIWIFSDLLYGLTPVGRLEARKIRTTRSLSALALRTAKEESPLGRLRVGEAHLREKSIKVGKDEYPKGLLDEATTLLFAGHDTQSATLSWCLLRLVQDVEIQSELRASLRDDIIEEALGLPPSKSGSRQRHSSEKTTKPAWATSAFAPTLEAVIRETLRLHPVAPLVVRMLSSDTHSEKMTIPKGCAVGVWLSSVHRDESVWERPEEFDPKRWFGGPAHARTGSMGGSSNDDDDNGGILTPSRDRSNALRHKGVGYMPFAYGPRSCVGQHLAQVTMRVALAHLVHAFEFAPSADLDASMPSVGFTVTPSTGAPVRVRLAARAPA